MNSNTKNILFRIFICMFVTILSLVLVALFLSEIRYMSPKADGLIMGAMFSLSLGFSAAFYRSRASLYFLGFAAFIFLNTIARHFAKVFVKYVANNITHSGSSPYNYFFEWDDNLEAFLYKLYLGIIILLFPILHFFYVKFQDNFTVKALVLLTFSLSLPVISSWSVYCPMQCAGLTSPDWIIIPVGITPDPISLVVGLLLASFIVKLYAKKFKK